MHRLRFVFVFDNFIIIYRSIKIYMNMLLIGLNTHTHTHTHLALVSIHN